MRPLVRSLVARYGLAVLAVAVALLGRLALDPLVGNRVPFLLFSLAVAVVAWHGGFGPSFLTLLLGLLAVAYFVLPPRYSLGAGLAAHRPQAAGFVFLGLTISLFSEGLRSARRRAEAHALEAVRQRRELEQEVVQRTQLEHELQLRADQLAQADRRKDEFLAMLGHELRNPLAPIHNAVQLVRLLDPADPGFQGAREMIERQVQHLTRLVDDLLDVSRITRGKITLRKERVDLGSVVARAVETSRPLIEANRHKLTLSPFAEPVRVVADPTRLEQVFANLLNNAAKYTEREGSIWLSGGRQGDEAVVRIRDAGCGIPAEVLPHVFEMFAQADRTLDRSQGGLGIGLTLVKTLVEMHGGKVEARSEGAGKGSEFVVRLPVSEEAGVQGEAAGAASRPVQPKAPSCLTVLVVEDNRDAAESLAMLLRLWGHEARTSHDGLSGLQAARTCRPQVVFLDIGLPGMDGYDVARRLRGEFGQAMRLVALTGYGQEEDRRKAEAAGFDVHLAKPADPAVLQAFLASVR